MEAEITVEELLKRENVSEVLLVDGNEETKFEKGMLNKDTLGKSVVKYWYDKEILYVELCL